MPAATRSRTCHCVTSRRRSRPPSEADRLRACSVYDALDGWGNSGATEAMHHELRRAWRIAAGREPEPAAAVIDSQSVKAAETVAAASRGFDEAKRCRAASGTSPWTLPACC
jgi:transposase